MLYVLSLLGFATFAALGVPVEAQARAVEDLRRDVARLEQDLYRAQVDLQAANAEAQRRQAVVDELPRGQGPLDQMLLQRALAEARDAWERVGDRERRVREIGGRLRETRDELRGAILDGERRARTQAEGLLAAGRSEQAVRLLLASVGSLDEVARLRAANGPYQVPPYELVDVPFDPWSVEELREFFEAKVHEGEGILGRIDAEVRRMEDESAEVLYVTVALREAASSGYVSENALPVVDEWIVVLESGIGRLREERVRIAEAVEGYRRRAAELAQTASPPARRE